MNYCGSKSRISTAKEDLSLRQAEKKRIKVFGDYAETY
jgi:hypothetical protein